MRTSRRLVAALIPVGILAAALAGLPAVAAAPAPLADAPAVLVAASPSPTPRTSHKPKPDKSHVPSEPIELRGTIRAATDEDGTVAYELVDGDGVAWELEAGPPWWWGTSNPLAASVGKTVTLGGERHPGEREVDVLSIDGTAIREAGRPPWAGGPKAVGERHPGWSAAKTDRWEAKQAARLARCDAADPPGYCKDIRVPTTTP
ncbi:MAG: hypothetical protein MUC54_04490 [Chloroflexi bacterium]|nr:hypothetical protein [Chloroflexota bacterium]